MTPRFIIGSVLAIGLISGIGLILLFLYAPISPSFVALALLLVVFAVMGLSGPVWWLILRKLMPQMDIREVVAMGARFSLWSGIFLASLMILKMLGFIDSILILAILALLIMIEMFLQQNSARKRLVRKTRRKSR